MAEFTFVMAAEVDLPDGVDLSALRLDVAWPPMLFFTAADKEGQPWTIETHALNPSMKLSGPRTSGQTEDGERVTPGLTGSAPTRQESPAPTAST